MRPAISGLATRSKMRLELLVEQGGERRIASEFAREDPADRLEDLERRLLAPQGLGDQKPHILERPPQHQQTRLRPRVPEKTLEEGVGVFGLPDEAVDVSLELGFIHPVAGQELRAELAHAEEALIHHREFRRPVAVGQFVDLLIGESVVGGLEETIEGAEPHLEFEQFLPPARLPRPFHPGADLGAEVVRAHAGLSIRAFSLFHSGRGCRRRSPSGTRDDICPGDLTEACGPPVV